MVHSPIVYSLFNIALSARRDSPRGVERIELGYISEIFKKWPSDVFGVLPTALGLRLFTREQVLSGRDFLASAWREHAEATIDPAFDWLKSAYGNPQPESAQISPVHRSAYWQGNWRLARLLLRNGLQFGVPISRVPKGAIYMDIGHNGLAKGFMHRWLAERPDVRPVFMLHDAIPLEQPDLISQPNVITHHKIMATTAAHARAIIVPTKSAGRSIQMELAKLGAPDIPIHPVNLPIDDIFQLRQSPDASFVQHPYFLVCGAIEVRKNPGLLLTVWRDLVTEHGAAAPRLIFAGQPSHGSDALIEEIRHSELMRRHVLVASGLSSKAIAKLMAGARALLMPSFAEGFGLPPLEAIAQGTPAVLSDIPAHREAIGDYGIFLDPRDGAAWRAQIEAMVADTPEYRCLKQRIAGFRPLSWPGYMAKIAGILQTVD